MEGGVDADVLLQHVEFQIFPSQGRYETCMCYGDKVEAASSGLLEQLVLHSPKIKSLHSKGSDSIFKFKPLGNLSDAKWFTKSTLIRFLCIISSSNIINVAKAMVNEISQLEDAQKFHLSLYSKGSQDHTGSRETADVSYSNCAAPIIEDNNNPSSSDASKNELLRAMDLRLTALTEELAAVFDQAVGTKCSFEDITNIEKFSYYFGAVELRNCLQKFVSLRQENTNGALGKEPSLSKNDVSNEKAGPVGSTSKTSRSPNPDTAVKYSASPAKAAQLERQSSSASEESSLTSEEEQPSVERSRTLIRSASPRRSASPMRRVQIGRSGSRRSTALTIKSLNFFPARERSVCNRDEFASDCDEEACEQTSKKSENSVQRMSVQDAIHLFENKQRGQIVDFQKTKTLNVSVANRAVLRRWSSGVCESANPVNVASGDQASLGANKLEDQEFESTLEMKPESHPTPEIYDAEAVDNDCKSSLPEERASSPEDLRKGSLPNQGEETDQKLNASVEWARKKEADLNQLLMRMMETKPTKYQNLAPGDSKLQRLPNERKGGFYDNYKEKRDEKLRGETTRKQAEKGNQFKALQQILDERKAEMISRKASNDDKKSNIKRTQKAVKNLPESANPRSGTPNPAVVKKVPLKTPPLPATRKSWPSAPSPRAAGISPAPAKTPGTTTPTRRLSQPVPSAPRSIQKVEKLQPKTVRGTENGTKRTVKGASEKKLETMTKNSKPRISKVQPASEDSTFSAKPKLSKVTKKSSVVPLESKEPKPFLRKRSGTGSVPSSGLGPVIEVKVSSQPEECAMDSVNSVQMEEKEMASVSFDPVNQVQDRGLQDLKVQEDKDSEAQAKSPQKCENAESYDMVTPNDTDDFGRIEDSTQKEEVEGEPNISASAWVEIEELEDQSFPSNGDFCNNESLGDVPPVRVSSPRVRHSLSQMLLKDNGETDVIDWGNAENPPIMIYQKDEPKGLKRLLKFARKSKTDANSTAFSSPPVFSEGEDDPEDSKVLTRRSSDLKKTTLHAKNAGQQKLSSAEIYELSAPTSIGKLAAKKLQEGHISASATTTKATRSFFSLSAFKGSKQNDAKLR